MSQSTATTDSPEVRARIDEALALVPVVIQQMLQLRLARGRHEDLASYGNVGALTAVRTYDAGFGVPFKRWATMRIRGAIIDGLRADSDLPRRMYEKLRALEAASLVEEGIALDDAGSTPGSAEAADACLTDRLTAMATAYAAGLLLVRDQEKLEAIRDVRGTPEEELARAELKAAVRAAVAERPDDERALLERYYFEDQTLEAAGGGLSRSWACRLHARAIEGVGKALLRAKVVGRHGP